MQDYKFTVIIPHKNIPELLERCLSSIPLRDDIQVIIVDDNSSNDIVDFNNFPGKNRKNTEIYLTKEGKGAGYARNIGVRHAKGQWLLFADADDFYTKDAWRVFDILSELKDDIIYFCVECVNSITLQIEDRNLKNNIVIENFLNKTENCEARLRFTSWEPWNKMFRSRFVEDSNLSFEEIERGNDAMFVLKAGYYAKKISAVNDILYTVTYRENSITFTPNKKWYRMSLNTIMKINRFYDEIGHSELKYFPFKEIIKVYKTFGLTETVREVAIILKSKHTINIIFSPYRWQRYINNKLKKFVK